MRSEDRPQAPLVGDERETLFGFLEHHRATLAWKCADLSPDQLVARPLPPTTLSLHGLVRHLTDVERWWFRIVWAAEPVKPRYWTRQDRDGDFDRTDPAMVEQDTAAWQEEIAAARAAVRDCPLDEVRPMRGRGEPVSLRWVVTHVLEEYARHNGHADLLREHTDGRTGV